MHLVELTHPYIVAVQHSHAVGRKRFDQLPLGGGNALDATDVKPRLNCKLAQIPSYTVSPEATGAGLQVTPVASVPTIYTVAPLRLLAAAYPDTQQSLGIAGSNLASLTPQGLQTRPFAQTCLRQTWPAPVGHARHLMGNPWRPRKRF